MGWSQLLQVLLSFGFVIALMLGLSHLVRRFGLEKRWQTARSSSAGGITVVDSLFLDARRRIVVVSMEQKRYALLMDGERAQLLDIITPQEERASE